MFDVLLNSIQTSAVSVTFFFILLIMLKVYEILREETVGYFDIHHAFAFVTKFVIMNFMKFSCD
jgi:hypothetical protein